MTWGKRQNFHEATNLLSFPQKGPGASTRKIFRDPAIMICNAGNDNIDETGEFDIATPFDKPALAVLDFLSLMLFAGIGKASHSADGSLDISAVFNTAGPFLLAWFSTSPITGVYANGDSTEDGIFDVGLRAAKGWVLAVPFGCVLRGLVKGYVPPLPFVVVTLISTLIIIGGSRIVYSVVKKNLKAE